jgi:exonuclease III
MNNCVDSGMFVGRPFGGVIAMISNSLRNFTRTIYCSDRCIIVKVGNYIIVSVYLPCSGTPDRLLLCQDIFNEFSTRWENYVNHEYVIAGDFNTDLDSKDVVALFINSFCVAHS